MPRGDRTGPLGEGPMTGRQLGFCAGYQGAGYGRGPGRGFGRGYLGRGRGRRFFWRRYVPLPEDDRDTAGYVDEVSVLQDEVRDLKGALERISGRLNRLEPDKNKKQI